MVTQSLMIEWSDLNFIVKEKKKKFSAQTSKYVIFGPVDYFMHYDTHYDIQHYDTQYNDIEHNDTQH